MRSLTKVAMIMTLITLLCHCDNNDPGPIVNIPDDNFLEALLELGIDTDGNGQISPEEAAKITFLDVSQKGISDLSGIEAFSNLDSLYCYNNQILLSLPLLIQNVSNSFCLEFILLIKLQELIL